MPQGQMDLVREHHEFTISCENQYSYVFGRCPRRGLLTSRQKFVCCSSEYVSRVHFEVFGDSNGVWRVKDLNSMNGTYVNEKLLAFGEVQILRAGDKIGVGIPAAGPHVVDGRNPKYFVFKFVVRGNRDSDGFAIPLPVPVAQPRRRIIFHEQILISIRNIRQMQREHRRHISAKAKHFPISRKRIQKVGCQSRAGTSFLTTKILVRWHSIIKDQIFKRKLRMAIAKVARSHKNVERIVRR